eukprot:5019732-Pyramimonas_sp.AAC.1
MGSSYLYLSPDGQGCAFPWAGDTSDTDDDNRWVFLGDCFHGNPVDLGSLADWVIGRVVTG